MYCNCTKYEHDSVNWAKKKCYMLPARRMTRKCQWWSLIHEFLCVSNASSVLPTWPSWMEESACDGGRKWRTFSQMKAILSPRIFMCVATPLANWEDRHVARRESESHFLSLPFNNRPHIHLWIWKWIGMEIIGWKYTK